MIKQIHTVTSGLFLTLLIGCSSGSQADFSSESTPEVAQSNPSQGVAETTVIDLTQTGCQFVEVESKDYGYQPTSGGDCKKINSETLSARESGFKPLELKPGKYVFRVTNSNVPYELGFYLRGKGAKKLTLPKVSGGGLTQGKTQDYEITLTPGNYVFSCPLNPTPDYPVIVN